MCVCVCGGGGVAPRPFLRSVGLGALQRHTLSIEAMAAFFVATSCRRADWMLIGLLLGLLLAAAVSSGQAAPLANYDDSAEGLVFP